MPHAGICTVSARQDDERQEICVAVCGYLHLLLQNSSYFCAIYPALDIPFPAIASRCNPRHWRRYHISLCHITNLGVWQARRCSAFLGVSRQYRWSEISTFTDLSIACSIVRRFRSVGSHHMQSSTATSRRRWRSHGVGKATPSQYYNFYNKLFKYFIDLFKDFIFSLEDLSFRYTYRIINKLVKN